MHTQLPRGADGNGVRTRRRPQPSMIVAIIALVAATGGTATALPGRSTVDRNDIAKNAVRSKAIKDGQVTGADLRDGAVASADLRDGAVASADLRDGAVASADIADGAIGGADLAKGAVTGAELADRTVAGADLAKGAVGGEQIAADAVGGEQIAEGAIGRSHIAPMEPFHLIGTPGEPQFSDGGEGDCVWKDGLPGTTGVAPVGFAKDALGHVWLQGVATATNGPGGDGRCDDTEPGEGEDGLVFALPPGYRPEHFDLSGIANKILLAPDEGAALPTTTIPPGGVYTVLTTIAALDGVSMRAASAAAAPAAKPAEVSLKHLAALAG